MKNLNMKVFFLLLFFGSIALTGCYIPPNEHVGKPAPHSYHQSYYDDGPYYYR
jgi:hypothetical protein